MIRPLLKHVKLRYAAPLVYGLTHGRWRTPFRDPQPGYTLILTVPPDLPVFTKLALDVCARQDHTHLVETVVVPDNPTEPFRQGFDAIRAGWPHGPIRLLEMSEKNRLIRAKTRNTSVIHWLQIITACEAMRSTHAVLHDVDLFHLDTRFFRDRHETCEGKGLHCLGVTQRLDMALGVDADLGRTDTSRVLLPELGHLLGTWELFFDVRWARSYTPAQLRPQYRMLRGVLKHLDTLHLPQYLCGPERIACHSDMAGFIHFSAVLTEYRRYEWTKGPFQDRSFRLLLIRLLIDAYDPDEPGYDLPDAAELTSGIGRPDHRIHYATDDSARVTYKAFRDELQRLLTSGLVDPAKQNRMRTGVERFDHVFDWSPSAG